MIPLFEDFEKLQFLAKCQQGLEEILSEEVKQLGATDITLHNRGITFHCNLKTLYRLHLSLRTAQKIIYPLYEFQIQQGKELYSIAKDQPWDEVFKVYQTFKIDAVVYTDLYNHTLYPALLLKDAICDYFRKKTGKRPSVDKDNPKISIYLSIRKNQVMIGIDCTGELLHKRHYRIKTVNASIKEDLAAGLILKTRWRGESDYIDLFCGSGTFLIEAAMIASNRSPNINRKQFNFVRWPNFNETLFKQAIDEAESIVKRPKISITGCDIQKKAYEAALRNIEKSGLSSWIKIHNISFDKLTPTDTTGIIVTNPPYDKRLKTTHINAIYELLGNHLKKHFTGWQAWILSGAPDAMQHLKLRPDQKYQFYNGDILCYYNAYQIR